MTNIKTFCTPGSWFILWILTNRWWRWKSAAPIKLFDRHFGLRLRTSPMRASFVVECVGLRLLYDFDVVRTVLFHAGSKVFLYQLPQQSVQTVYSHRMLAVIVDNYHETSAFRYTQFADRRRDVITPTSGG